MIEEYARLIVEVSDNGADKATRDLKKLEQQGGKSEKATDRLRKSVGSLRGALLGLGAGVAFREVVKAADEFQGLQAQLRLVSDSSEEAADSYQKLRKVANATSSDLSSSVELYARLARSTEDLGLSQDQLLTLTTAVNQSFQVSGASTEEAAGAIRQLSQAFSAGALRGDEFNTVNEAAPRLMQALADATGHSRGELRKLAGEGKLTAKVIAESLGQQADTIATEFAVLPDTVGRAFQRLKNDALNAFGQTDTSGLVDAMEELRDIVNDPGFQRNMVDLATAVADLIGFTAKAAGAFVDFGRGIGEAAARLVEGESELMANDRAIKQLDATIKSGVIIDGTLATGIRLATGEYIAQGTSVDVLKKKLEDLKKTQEEDYFGGYTGGGKKPKAKPEDPKPTKPAGPVELGGGTGDTLGPIQKRIQALELEAKTVTLSAKAAELYRLKLQGATDEELRAAGVALDRVEAEEGLNAARKAATAAEEARKADFATLVDDLRSEEEAIIQSYQRRRQIILDNTKEGSDQQKDLLARLKSDFRDQALGGFGDNANTFDAQKQRIMDEFDQRKSLILSNEQLLEEERTALVTELTTRRNDQLRNLEAAHQQQMLGDASTIFGGLADLARGYGGEQSKAYKRLFAVSKAFSIAQAGMSIATGLAKAQELGFPANIAEMIRVAAQGGAALSQIRGSNFAGAFDNGGMIPAGKVGLVGEVGPEFVRGPAQVTGRFETAAAAKQAMGGGGGAKITNINVLDPSIVGDYLSTDEGEELIVNVMQKNRRRVA